MLLFCISFIQMWGQTCRSEATITVAVAPSNSYTYNESICLGSDYQGHDITIKAPKNDTVYRWEVDCDDHTLNLKVCKPAENNIFASICEGQTYSKYGFNESKGGVYTRTEQTSCGCDSVINLHLNVISLSTTSLFDKFCVNEPYTGRGHNNIKATKDTVLKKVGMVQGCPSTVLLYLTACYPATTQLKDVCERGKRYDKFGFDFVPYKDTVAVLDLKTTQGCDSTVTLTLDVYHDYYFEEEEKMCRGGSYVWRNNSYSEKGIYYDSLKTDMGLDSIYCLKLEYFPDYEIEEHYTVPIGTQFTWHGKTYIGGGTYYDSLKTVNQCDSIYIMHLKECIPYYFTEDATICNGEVYEWHRMEFAATGKYFDKYLTIEGCDSIYELNLTVLDAPEFEIVVSEDYSHEDGGIKQLVEVTNLSGGLSPYLCSLDHKEYADAFQFWFTNYMRGDHSFRVKDSNDCVTEQKIFYKGVRVPLVIPAYFSPDGDGNNDTWVIKNLWFYERSTVEIYDRFGKRLAYYNADVNSWNGEYNGHPMPSDDYWYIIRLADTGEKISGHFILKR